MSDLHLAVGNKAYSSWSLRPWIAMKVNGLAFRETVIPLREENTATQIGKFSPSGKVPALSHGAVTVWESLAILEYLADAFPDKSWWPREAVPRAVARSVAAEMHGGFTNLRGYMPMNLRKVVAKKTTPEVDGDIARLTAIWRDCRQRFGEGRGAFLFGAFGNADAMYVPIATRFKTYSVKIDAVSQAYCDALLNLPAMKDWYAAASLESWVVPKYEEAANTP